MRIVVVALGVLAGLLGAPTVLAAPPGTVPFQTRVVDAAGDPLNGAANVQVRLLDAPTDGTELWTELHPNVPLSEGYASLSLGSITPLPSAAFASGPRYVEIIVDGSVMQPRTLLGSVPFAVTASRLVAEPSEPASCTAEEAGRIYYDTSRAAVRVCAGDRGWTSLAPAQPGETAATAAGSCLEIRDAVGAPASGIYWIDVDIDGPLEPRELYCDMTTEGGGWTLVAQISGRHTNNTWLRTDANLRALTTGEIESSQWSSTQAVGLAVERATEVRLSNEAVTRWVAWPMATDRTLTTWWNHAASQSTINAAPDSPVTVRSHTGATGSCFQNRYGIMPLQQHGGSYPAATFNTAGNTTAPDLCMAVGVQTGGANGFSQNGNGYDAPSDETWPNTRINITPKLSVWLR